MLAVAAGVGWGIHPAAALVWLGGVAIAVGYLGSRQDWGPRGQSWRKADETGTVNVTIHARE